MYVFCFPLSRAEHRRGGRNKARGLSEPADRRGSFRVLRPQRRRAGLSGTRAFSFASFSSHVKENEDTIPKTIHRIRKISRDRSPEVAGSKKNNQMI
jgi:hypothetical protein